MHPCATLISWSWAPASRPPLVESNRLVYESLCMPYLGGRDKACRATHKLNDCSRPEAVEKQGPKTKRLASRTGACSGVKAFVAGHVQTVDFGGPSFIIFSL